MNPRRRPGGQRGHGTQQQTVDRQLVLGALRTLSSEHRQVLFECYFRGASMAEAADALGVRPDIVKSRTHYALHALRRAIDAERRRLGAGKIDRRR
jgi:DNA-directed RNA polymerase specialized sigma24 family protein